MFFFYNMMMSGRLFHSADLDGLQEALTDTDANSGSQKRN